MNHKHIFVAALLFGVASPLAAQSVKSGIEAWQHSDYEGAVKIWRPLAEQGDADAQFDLAQAYRLGRGVPTNLTAAQIWLERAAVQGHLDAQTTLGLLLFQSGNRPGAMRWLKAAAERDDARAMLVYGTALFNGGDSVTQDSALGYAYVSRAAAQGLAPAKTTLAQMTQVVSAADRKKAAALVAAAKTQAKPDAGTAEAKPSAKSSAAKEPATAKQAAAEKGAPAKAAAAKAPPAEKMATGKAVAKKAAPTQGAAQKPATAEKAPPRARPAVEAKASGSWRIQLGAFSQRGTAEALFRKLSGSAPVSGRSVSYSAAGAVTRLQVGPFESKAAADEACRTLLARGQPCFPIPGK